jgi:acetylornithine deacetylase
MYLPARDGRSVYGAYTPWEPPTGSGAAAAREFIDWVFTRSESDEWLSQNPPRFTWGSDIPPAELDPDHPLVAAVLDGARRVGCHSELGGFDSWYDGASFILAGAPAVAFGPPGVSEAHATDESVAIDDLVTCAQALAASALAWGQ